MGKFRSFFDRVLFTLDFYKEKYGLFLDKNPEITTFSSRALSIMLFSFLGIYIFKFYDSYSENWVSLSHRAASPTGYPMTINQENFTFAIAVVINGTIMNSSDSYFSLNLYALNNTGGRTYIQMGPCNQSYNKFGSQYFCPAEDFSLVIQGSPNILSQSFHQGLNFELGKCKNSSVISCSANLDNLTELIMQSLVILSITVPQVYPNESNYESPVFSYPSSHSVLVTPDHQFETYFYDVSIIKTFGFFFNELQEFYSYTFDADFSQTFTRPAADHLPYYKFAMYTSPYLTVYERQFMNVVSLIGTAGGFMYPIVFLLSFLAYFFVQRERNHKLWSSVAKKNKVYLSDNIEKEPEKDNKIEDSLETSLKNENTRTALGNYLYKSAVSANNEGGKIGVFKFRTSKSKNFDEQNMKFMEKSLEISNLINLEKKIEKLAGVFMNEDEKMLFYYKEDYYLTKEDIEEFKQGRLENIEIAHTKKSYDFDTCLSQDAVEELKQKYPKIEINEVNNFMRCYYNYLEISKSQDQKDQKLLQMLNKNLRVSLEELSEKTRGLSKKSVEKFVVDSIVDHN